MADGQGGQVNWFLDQVDDPLLPDGCPAFDGGQFSNLRANLLQPNQSKVLGNCDIDKLGKLRTRRGTLRLGTGPPSGTAGTIIQGLTFYEPPIGTDDPYIVAVNDKKLWRWTEGSPGTWTQIATGGVKDDEDVIICREGQIDQNVASAGLPHGGYAMGTTVLVVSDLPNVTAPLLKAGEKLYFQANRRTAPYEYVISNWAASGATAGTITLEEPGLVFDVQDNWKFTVARTAKVNGDHAAAAVSLTIKDYSGEVDNSEKFVIVSENKTRGVDNHSPVGSANTTGLTFTGGLQGAYTTSTNTNSVTFAQGNDSLYFCDGVDKIYSWNGSTLGKLDTHSILDDLQGTDFSHAVTAPPSACHILLWFQNRLIASGVASEPDAIFFSDYFDASSWDRNYQMVRIGGGESDPITGLLAWTDYNLLVFKKNSIYVINLDPSQNPNPDDPTLLVASFSVKQLHKKIGCPAPLTAVQVGGGSTTPGSDIFFVDGDKKVHSIRRVMAAETQQEVGTAVSLPIQDVLDTINLEHIDKACATYHNEHYILGIPSTIGESGGTYPNAVVAYNLLTQSWCGVWAGWRPTCFAMRTDLGSYSKMIFGESNIHPSGAGWTETGNVLQWLDDVSLEEETDETYEDYGHPIRTQIMTRAFTGGDFYSFKTGMSVEFEFDESVAEGVLVKVFLDKIEKAHLTVAPFNTLTELRVRLPVPGGTPLTLPFTLPTSPDLMRLAFDLQRYGTWRELQFLIDTRDPVYYGAGSGGKLAIRSIRLTYFMDTLRLQTVPVYGVFGTSGEEFLPGGEGP